MRPHITKPDRAQEALGQCSRAHGVTLGDVLRRASSWTQWPLGGPFQLSLLSGSMKDFPVSKSDGIHLFIMKSAKAKDSFYHVFGETLIHGFEKLLINPISTIFQPISRTPVQSARSTCSPQCTGSNTTASKKQLWPLIYLYQYS